MTDTANGGEAAGEGAQPLLRAGAAWRSGLYYTIHLAAFAAVNAFWRYLATGQWASFHPAAYYQDLTTPLGEIFRHPLDILTHPWMIVVSGLLLGLVALVPILVAVLYRSQRSVPFVLIVAVVGHAPVLALAVAIGCALASRSSLRREMPFLASVLGLLPTAAYFALSALAGVDAAAVLPLQRWALYAPFLIAFVSAVLAGAIVLGLARLTGLRSGPVCPLVVLLLGAPVATFYVKVGADELDYALIVNRLQADGSIFEDEALGPWVRRNRADGLNPRTIRVRVQEDLHARRDALVQACERFLARYGDSPREAALMWLRAQTMSLQLDEVALAGGLIKYSPSFLRADSAEAWASLRRNHPDAPQAVLADWHLGELALRAVAHDRGGDPNALVRKAEKHLRRAREALAEMFPAAADQVPAPAPARMFSPPADVPSRDYFRGAREAVERLVWLMERNHVLTDANSAEALGAYLELNPKQPDYYRRLTGLLSDTTRKREATAMGDNLKLAVALNTPNLYERTEMLIQLAKDERTDAAITANFELGLIALKPAEAPARPLMTDLKTAEEYFRIIIAAPPNPYQQEAARLLASLASRAKADE
jgi:hypothetical protein